MVKSVVLIAIIVMAAVNAQYPFRIFETRYPDGVFSLPNFKNLKVMTPDEVFNAPPGPYQNYHASYMKTVQDGDGPVRTIIKSNDNGKKTDYTFTN